MNLSRKEECDSETSPRFTTYLMNNWRKEWAMCGFIHSPLSSIESAPVRHNKNGSIWSAEATNCTTGRRHTERKRQDLSRCTHLLPLPLPPKFTPPAGAQPVVGRSLFKPQWVLKMQSSLPSIHFTQTLLELFPNTSVIYLIFLVKESPHYPTRVAGWLLRGGDLPLHILTNEGGEADIQNNHKLKYLFPLFCSCPRSDYSKSYFSVRNEQHNFIGALESFHLYSRKI